MHAVFIDTSAWDALEDSSDRNHVAAVSYRATLRQERMPLYVTNFVVDEGYTLGVAFFINDNALSFQDAFTENFDRIECIRSHDFPLTDSYVDIG